MSYECLTRSNAPGRCIHSSECAEHSNKSIEQLRPHLCFNYRKPGLPTVVCCSHPQTGGAGAQRELSPTLATLTPPGRNDSIHPNTGHLWENCGKHSGCTSGSGARGGEDAALGEYPWMTLLKYRQGKYHLSEFQNPSVGKTSSIYFCTIIKFYY